jgi:hypothetical protein
MVQYPKGNRMKTRTARRLEATHYPIGFRAIGHRLTANPIRREGEASPRRLKMDPESPFAAADGGPSAATLRRFFPWVLARKFKVYFADFESRS